LCPNRVLSPSQWQKRHPPFHHESMWDREVDGRPAGSQCCSLERVEEADRVVLPTGGTG
jgi:hypothetical protein